MGATTTGGLIGAAIDGLSGDDGVADGAAIGAVTFNAIKLIGPLVLTFAVGYAVLRGGRALTERVFGGDQG